jgi:hypothetical protein
LRTSLGLRRRRRCALAATSLARKQGQSAGEEQVASIHPHIHRSQSPLTGTDERGYWFEAVSILETCWSTFDQ